MWKVALFWKIEGNYRKSWLLDNMRSSSFVLSLDDSKVSLYFGLNFCLVLLCNEHDTKVASGYSPFYIIYRYRYIHTLIKSIVVE